MLLYLFRFSEIVVGYFYQAVSNNRFFRTVTVLINSFFWNRFLCNSFAAIVIRQQLLCDCHWFVGSVLVDLLEVPLRVVLPGEPLPVPGPAGGQVPGDLVCGGLLLGVALIAAVGEGVREDFWKRIRLVPYYSSITYVFLTPPV